MDYQNIKDILPFSDLWRYNLIYKTGETWLDMDMILLDQLPYDHIIISSEYTFQRGAFKSKKIEVCNIGVLRFPKGDLIIKSIIDKINKQKKESKFIDNMKTFRKIIVKSDYKDKIAHPNSYCPLPWWSVKESYYNSKYLPKYGVTSPTNEEILNKSTSVHLWNNFTYNKSCIDFTKIDNYSLYNLLKNLYNI